MRAGGAGEAWPRAHPPPGAAPAAHLPRGQGVRCARRAHRGGGRAACPRRTPAAAQVLPPEPRAGRCAAEPQTRRPGRGAPGAGKAAGPGRASVCLPAQWGRGRRPSAADWRPGLGGGRPRDVRPPSALTGERPGRPRSSGPMPRALAAQPPGAGTRSFLTQPHLFVARKFSQTCGPPPRHSPLPPPQLPPRSAPHLSPSSSHRIGGGYSC